MANQSRGRVFVSRMYPAVETSLGKPGTAEELSRHIKSVLGSEHVAGVLDKTHPGDVVYIGQEAGSGDLAPIFALCGITAEDVKRAVRDTGVVNPSWAHTNKPHYWALMMAIRYFSKKRDADKTREAVLLMAVCMYAGLVFRYFRRFYQPNVMSYAVNTLSDRFILKQEGTMLKAILSIAWRCHEKYAADLERGSDLDLVKYIVSMWGRLNGMVKTLKGHYEEVKASGKYLNPSKEKNDDGSIAERPLQDIQIADRISERFFIEPVPQSTIELASEMADVPKRPVMLAVDEIRDGDHAPIREAIATVVGMFFEEEKENREGLKTRKFLSYANSLYMRSNTTDRRVEKVKETLDKLLLKHSREYRQTKRPATRGALRKALYLTLILTVQMQGARLGHLLLQILD